MMKSVNYEETPEFQKDFKKLLKRYFSLENDLDLAKIAAIELCHVHKIDNSSVVLVPGFCHDNIKICKIRKFACDALKNRGAKSGIRIIYAFWEQELKVVFLEIYYKGDQEKEKRDRIQRYLDEQKEG